MVATSDCYPRIDFLIPGSKTYKFVILGSDFGIRFTDWSLLLALQDLFCDDRMQKISK